MRLKIVENFDPSFTLSSAEKEALFDLLNNESFLQQISQQIQGIPVRETPHFKGGASSDFVRFTGLLFQPVPYSITTPKGMPIEFEPYHNSPEYIIINVPPHFMFKAKIFKPSRLCAIYQKLV